MKATAIARSKEIRDDGTIIEVVVWELPEPLPPNKYRYKYRLYYGRPGEERVRYDNVAREGRPPSPVRSRVRVRVRVVGEASRRL